MKTGFRNNEFWAEEWPSLAMDETFKILKERNEL
jgi:hypothetical protein